MIKFDIAAVGNAIVDVLAKVDDSFLRTHKISKGGMKLVEQKEAEAIYAAMESTVQKSGGSAANTAAGVVSLGGRAAFIGKVKKDDLGAIFQKDIKDIGVHYSTAASIGGLSTAMCLVAVTDDAQRSMATFLGATREITHEDIDEEIIASAKVAYLEGYLWDEQHAKDAMRRAAHLAKKHYREIAFSLSDPFCVQRHREEFLEIIKDSIDILFANEDEIKALFQMEQIEDAIPQLQDICKIAAITKGNKGSVIITKDKVYNVEVGKNLKVVDTTGAGDLYAGGFLYAYTQGKDIAECGRIATIAASEVICHMGARPEVKLSDLI